MNKIELKQMIDDNLSTRKISNITNKSQTTIRYWLKKYDLSTNHESFKNLTPVDYGDTRFCPRCQKECLTSDFYNRRGKKNSSVYCKPCTGQQTMDRVRSFKTKCVEYKGGCCKICGYNKYIGALEFHHLDPSLKDFTISHLKSYTFDSVVINELDKCILVCANCHREIHFNLL